MLTEMRGAVTTSNRLLAVAGGFLAASIAVAGSALACLALQAARLDAPRIAKGLEWLRVNPDHETGRWTTTSLNKQRDPASEPGKFMDDAATAYAVLALTYKR
jgi:hypothetical protein